jgi:hypothetical protein
MTKIGIDKAGGAVMRNVSGVLTFISSQLAIEMIRYYTIALSPSMRGAIW